MQNLITVDRTVGAKVSDPLKKIGGACSGPLWVRLTIYIEIRTSIIATVPKLAAIDQSLLAKLEVPTI